MSYLGNRRGQIAILMLFLVAIILVVTTLFFFFSSDSASPPSSGYSEVMGDGRSNMEGVGEMAKLIAKESIISKAPDTKEKFLEIANVKYNSLSASQVAPYGNFFRKVIEEEFSFGSANEELYNLEIKGLFVEASFWDNYERKEFDLCMLFDKDGNYLKELANEEFYKSYCAK